MKELGTIALALALLAGCDLQTKHGKCVGWDRDDKKDPALVYEVSTWNVVMGVIFVETVFAPLIVAMAAYECPQGKKPEAK